MTTVYPSPSEEPEPEPELAFAAGGRCVVIVPVYRTTLTPLERFSLRRSLDVLQRHRNVVLIAPASLDLSDYTLDFGLLDVVRFPDVAFASVQGYSRLLLDPAFYRRFAQFEFMLILQTDALLLRDDLDRWTAADIDYVGAPWPTPVQLRVELDRFAPPHTRHVRTQVGNGGLSLRRIAACLDLLEEFPQARQWFVLSGSSEDLFFAVCGMVSRAFVLPSEALAARFSLELEPSRYDRLNDGVPPMGGHAWWKYEPAYWIARLGVHGPEAARLVGAAAAGTPPPPLASRPASEPATATAFATTG